MLGRSPSIIYRELRRTNLTKITNFPRYAKEKLDAISCQINIRSRKRFDFRRPMEVMTEIMSVHHAASRAGLDPVSFNQAKKGVRRKVTGLPHRALPTT